MQLVMNFLMGEMAEKYHGNRAADVLGEKLRLMEVERVEAIAMLQAKILYVEAAYCPWGRNVLGKQQIFSKVSTIRSPPSGTSTGLRESCSRTSNFGRCWAC